MSSDIIIVIIDFCRKFFFNLFNIISNLKHMQKIQLDIYKYLFRAYLFYIKAN